MKRAIILVAAALVLSLGLQGQNSVVNNQPAEGSLIAMVNDYMAAMSYLETVKQTLMAQKNQAAGEVEIILSKQPEYYSHPDFAQPDALSVHTQVVEHTLPKPNEYSEALRYIQKKVIDYSNEDETGLICGNAQTCTIEDGKSDFRLTLEGEVMKVNPEITNPTNEDIRKWWRDYYSKINCKGDTAHISGGLLVQLAYKGCTEIFEVEILNEDDMNLNINVFYKDKKGKYVTLLDWLDVALEEYKDQSFRMKDLAKIKKLITEKGAKRYNELTDKQKQGIWD